LTENQPPICFETRVSPRNSPLACAVDAGRGFKPSLADQHQITSELPVILPEDVGQFLYWCRAENGIRNQALAFLCGELLWEGHPKTLKTLILGRLCPRDRLQRSSGAAI